MVADIKRGSAAAISAFFLCASVLPAETLATTEISAFAAAIRSSGATEASVYALSEVKLTLSSLGASGTKGQATLDFKAGDAVLIDLQKAWMKARLGSLVLTSGKTRLAWGEGALFNAGNVIFGTSAVDLSAEDLRDENAWLVAAAIPFGDFSFIEAVFLPPDPPLAAIIADSLNPMAPDPVFGGWENCSAGGRAYTKLGGVKLEAGYLWAGEPTTEAIVSAAHKPYASLQGNLWVDWHLSSSANVDPADGAVSDWTVSTGAYRQWPVPASGEESGDSSLGTLALRLEALIRPNEAWNESTVAAPVQMSASSLSGGTSLESPYALLLYPELSWRATTLFVFLRSLVSPVDLSARTAFALQWGPLQGFKIIGNVSVQTGEDGDLFAWDRVGAWQAMIGSRLSY